MSIREVKMWLGRALHTLEVKMWFWIVRHLLPKKLIYFSFMHVMAYSTCGKYSDTVVPELTGMEAIRRYEEKT